MNRRLPMTSVLQPVSQSGDWHQLSGGRAGMIGLIIAEASLLAIFVVAYLFYIGKSLNGPYPKDVLEVQIFNTLCLLASSVTVGLAVRTLRQGDRHWVGAWLPVTALLGVVFLVGIVILMIRRTPKSTLLTNTNLFG